MSSVTFSGVSSKLELPKRAPSKSMSSGISRHHSDSKLNDVRERFSRGCDSPRTLENERIIKGAESISKEKAGLHHRSSPRSYDVEAPPITHQEGQSLLGRVSPVKERHSSPPRITGKKEEGDSCCQKMWNCFSECFSPTNEKPAAQRSFPLSDHTGMFFYWYD